MFEAPRASCRDGESGRGRAGVRGPDRGQAGGQPAGAGGRVRRRSGGWSRLPALRVLRRRDPGDDPLPWPLGDPQITNITEEESRPADAAEAQGSIAVQLEPFEIVTVRAGLQVDSPTTGARPDLAPRSEAAQPVFSGYWLHNKGAAPLGYQPVTVQIRPWLVSGDGPFNLPIAVASERTDGSSAGTVTLEVPPGWEASPPERLYRLAPGAHLEFDASIVPAAWRRDRSLLRRCPHHGRGRPAARRRRDDRSPPGRRGDGDGPERPSGNAASPSLAFAIERALRTSGIAPEADDRRGASDGLGKDPGGELVAEVLTRDVRVRAARPARSASRSGTMPLARSGARPRS